MQPPFRSKQEVIIDAPLEAVWSYSMDLTKIPEFHPRVVKVDLLSGKTLREPGASYQCHLSGGKHTCIEKDIEIIPLQKIVTVLPEDTSGISKILSFLAWPSPCARAVPACAGGRNGDSLLGLNELRVAFLGRKTGERFFVFIAKPDPRNDYFVMGQVQFVHLRCPFAANHTVHFHCLHAFQFHCVLL